MHFTTNYALFSSIESSDNSNWFNIHFLSLISLLSLDILALSSNTDDAPGICFVDALTAINEELWHLFFPALIRSIVVLLYLVNLFFGDSDLNGMQPL